MAMLGDSTSAGLPLVLSYEKCQQKQLEWTEVNMLQRQAWQGWKVQGMAAAPSGRAHESLLSGLHLLVQHQCQKQ